MNTRITTPVLWGVLGVFVVLAAPVSAEEEPTAQPPEASPTYWLAKAEAITKQMPHPEGRAALLVSIGTGWVEAGEMERARPLLASAAKYGRQCQGCISKARRLAEVALLQHEAGDEMGAGDTFETARAACDELDGARRVQALAYLAQQRQAAGERMLARLIFADAVKAAEALEGVEQAEAFAAITDAEYAAGNPTEARTARLRVAGATRPLGFEGDVIHDATWLNAAMAHLAAGRLQDAHDMVEDIHSRPLRVSGYAAFARGAFGAGETERATAALDLALEIASNLEDPLERADALAEAARAAWAIDFAEQGRLAQAALGAAVDEIEDPASKFGARVAWVELFRAAGDDALLGKGLARLETRLAELEVDDATRDALRGLLLNLEARVGARPTARRQVQQITDPVRRARAWLDLADHARAAGQSEQALGAIRRVLKQVATWGADRKGDVGELMRRAAVLQAACGQPEEAVKTVDAIDAPFHAATACTYIARDLT